MKQQITHSLLALSILGLSTQVFAIDKFSGTLTDDIYFPSGVLLENVQSSKAGEAEITLEGTGSLTIGNQSGGGFPRISVAGGTKIESKRTDTSTTWAGQFTAPGSTRKPASSNISFAGGNHTGNTPEAVATYTWGLATETFTYTPAARVVLPVNSPDGQKLWVAYPKTGDAWAIQEDDFCIVESSLCYFETGSINSVTLVKESFGSCPVTSVENGSVGGTPNCIITCNRGYTLGDDARSCAETGDLTTGGDDDNLTSQTNNVEAFSGIDEDIVLPEKEYSFMPGHFRFRDSGRRGKNLLDEDSLDGDELIAAKHTNTSFLSRNPRTAKSQLNKETGKSSADKMKEDESFASYLIQMRNSFTNEKTQNEVIALSQDSETKPENPENKDLHASAGKLLPSTGPSLFFIIAIVGFLLMMFSGVRRN